MPLDENGEGVLVSLGRPHGKHSVRQVASQLWGSSTLNHDDLAGGSEGSCTPAPTV